MDARSAAPLLALAALAGAAMWARVDHAQAERAWARERGQAIPRDAARAEYAGSESCRACHPTAYASWHDSYHRTMTQPASRESIDPPWEGELPGDVTLRWNDARPEVVRRGRVDPVVMTTGSHHMQIFWTPGDTAGSLEAFEYAWLTGAQRFVPNAATLLRPDGDDAVYTWNRICIRCHAVAGNPGWNDRAQTVRSDTVELGIACEACHGPAAAHAEHHRNPLQRWLRHDAPHDVVQPADLEPRAASEVCAQCHAITQFDDEAQWLASGSRHAAGDPIDTWGTLLRHPMRSDDAVIDDVLANDPDFVVDRWWSDGMVRVTGREHNALVESPCTEGGELSCLSCHSMHDGTRDDQLAREMDGDAACTQCHEDPRLASTEHTHHEDVRCMDCHMPRTTWGLLGAIRSHQVDSPDPIASDETGRPLACNLCHLDRAPAWSAAWLARWRGDDRPIPADDPAATGVLSAEAGVRALWAWHLGQPGVATSGMRWQLDLLVEALADPYPAVREVAWQSIQRLWALAVATSVAAPTIEAGTIADIDDAARIRAAIGPSTLDPDYVVRSIAARDDRRVALAE